MVIVWLWQGQSVQIITASLAMQIEDDGEQIFDLHTNAKQSGAEGRRFTEGEQSFALRRLQISDLMANKLKICTTSYKAKAVRTNFLAKRSHEQIVDLYVLHLIAKGESFWVANQCVAAPLVTRICIEA